MKQNKLLALKSSLMVILLLVSSNALAAKSDFGAVTDVTVSANGKVTVEIDAPAVNPAGCPQNGIYVIEPNDISKNHWMAQLLTAQAAEYNVQMIINDTICVNNNKNAKISGILIKP